MGCLLGQSQLFIERTGRDDKASPKGRTCEEVPSPSVDAFLRGRDQIRTHLPPLPWSNAQGADTTRPMTDATDAVATSFSTSVLLVLLHNTLVFWSGATQAEVSPPNSLYSLCGGHKTAAAGECIEHQVCLVSDTDASPRERDKTLQLIIEKMSLFLGINLPTKA